MSRQKDALDRITPGLCHKYPGCGILLFGSVGRGDDGPDSDLDIIVVFEGEGPLKWDPGAPIGDPDLNVDLAVFPEPAFRRLAETRWFVFYEFSQAKIIHDPTGIAERNQAPLRDCMRRHPEVVRVWEEYLASYRRSKKEAGYKQLFERSDLEKHLERLLKESESH